MKQRIIFCGIAILFVAAAFFVARSFLRSHSNMDVPVKSMKTWQQADTPLGYPLNAEAIDPETGAYEAPIIPDFDPRLIQLDAFERMALPTATRMSAPMGSEQGALTYNAQRFWENNTKRGGRHTGDDFNGIGGMNTDLGDPIYAVADSRVVYRGEPSLCWGNILILAHRTPQGSTLLSMYSHMDQMHVALGSTISRGEIIGTVGTANSNYPAHLHFEMHDSSGIHIGAGYTAAAGDRIDPTSVIAQHQTTNSANLTTSILALVLHEEQKKKREIITINSSEKPTK